jgi:hypothetical protein
VSEGFYPFQTAVYRSPTTGKWAVDHQCRTCRKMVPGDTSELVEHAVEHDRAPGGRSRGGRPRGGEVMGVTAESAAIAFVVTVAIIWVRELWRRRRRDRLGARCPGCGDVRVCANCGCAS